MQVNMAQPLFTVKKKEKNVFLNLKKVQHVGFENVTSPCWKK